MTHYRHYLTPADRSPERDSRFTNGKRAPRLLELIIQEQSEQEKGVVSAARGSWSVSYCLHRWSAGAVES